MIIITPALIMASVSADGGMISFHEFDVYEPGQKAIIAWDGETEIMILSVDVYSEQSTKALHMVPFPSLPEVELGSVESFEKIEEIINRNRYNYEYYGDNGTELAAPDNKASVEIVFHEKVGPHDITAVQINSPVEFTEWVNNFLKGKGITNKKMPDELDNVIEHYTQQDIRYFVFDVVDLDPNKKSVDPIVYTFESEYLFFPLEISSIIKGETEITLALIMPTDLPVNKNNMRELGFYSDYNGIVSQTDIEDISENIAEILNNKASLSLYNGYFSLSELQDDVMIRKLANVNWMYTLEENLRHYEISESNKDGNYEISFTTYDKLYVLDTETGNLKHECNLKEVENVRYGHFLKDLNADGTTDIITSDYYDLVQSYDGSDASLIWEFKLQDEELEINDINGIKFDDDSGVVFVYTETTIFGIKSENGKEIWKYEISDGLRMSNYHKIEDINLDGELDLIVDTIEGTIIVLDIEDGTELWRFKTPIMGTLNKEFSDLSSHEGMELVYMNYHIVHVLNTQTGKEIWNSADTNDNLDIIISFDLVDLYGYNDKLEVIIRSPDGIYILDGEDGKILGKINFNMDLAEFELEDMYNTKILDIDSDGDDDFCGEIDEVMYAFDLKNGDKIWEFSTGDHISYYEAADLDADGKNELFLMAGNKIYTVEYDAKESKTDSDHWESEQFVLIGSIVLPLIIIVILQLLLLKMFGKRKKTY